MAKFKGKDLYLANDDQIYFGDNQEAAMWYDDDGELHLNHTLSGIRASDPYHMVRYDQLTEASGTLQTQITNNYISLDNKIDTTSGTLQGQITYYSDHGNLSGLSDDDHTHYILVNGTRAFTGTVSGISPIDPAHLVTKNYVDSVVGEATTEVTYVPYTLSLIAGTYISGDVTDVQVLNDGNTYDVNEVAATPGFNIEFTCSGVSQFNRLRTHLFYDGHAGHTVHVDLWNYDTTVWDTFISFNGVYSGLTWFEAQVTNGAPYIDEATDGGEVRIRIYHVSNGSVAHDIYVDYVAVAKAGFGISTDHGSLTGLLDDDHPQYLLTADATDRTTFATNWTDLTDGNDTTLHIHDSRYYTESEVDTISGSLQIQITTYSDHGNLSGLGDDDHTQYILTDGSRGFTSTVSGVDPVQDYHLATKYYVDETLTSGVGRAGQYSISDATEKFTVNLVQPLDTINYYVVASIENTTDVEPANYSFTITNTTLSGFDVDLSDITDSANYKFNYAAVYGDVTTVIGVSVPGPQGIQGPPGPQGETGASGLPGTTDHGLLTGLEDDDHPQYILVDGSRGFTSTVSGVTPIQDYELTTKEYVDDAITTATGSLTTDHGSLTGLTDDDHPQYLLRTDFTTYSGSMVSDWTSADTTLSGALQTQIDNISTELISDTTPQLGGDLDLNEHYIELNPSPDSNQTGNGLMATVTVDVNATGIGAALFIAADFHYEEADADAVTTMPCVALALESGTGSKKVLLKGYFRNDSWNWSAGLIYVSTTAGALTQTKPSGSGNQVQIAGYAVSADVMYFDPQLPMVEIV